MHPVIVESLQLIMAGDTARAERALVAIAEQEGDRALVSVLDEMPPKDLLAVMREFDASKESVVNLLVTPEQFARAVVLEKKYGESNHDKLRGMINAVIHSDPAMVYDYLEAISAIEGGYETLANYFGDRFEELIHFATEGTFTLEYDAEAFDKARSITLLAERLEELDQVQGFGDSLANARPRLGRAEIADADWMETAWVLRYELPDDFEQVVMILRDRMQRMLEAFAEAQAPSQPAATILAADEEESAI